METQGSTRRAMHGVLLVDKPPGMSSAEVVRRVKRLVRPARVGHLGTLDPFATGLLPILIGEATKLAQFLEHDDKRYEGLIALGAETDTLDCSGRIVARAPLPDLDRASLNTAAQLFAGEVSQVPPVYSAIKREGVPLYKLARRGANPPPPAPRTVRISELTLEAANSAHLRFAVVCSPGTYVRALARDIAAALGSAGHLAQLRRTRTAGFSITQAVPLEVVMEKAAELPRMLIGLREALPEMAELPADEVQARRLRNGDIAAFLELSRPESGRFKLVCNNELIAIAEATPEHGARLLRVFAP